MNEIDGSRLDLNLLRVLVAVADTGSVTAAARRLYLTQSAVSAALKRLTSAVGAPLFARAGRGIALTARGVRLLEACRPHLEALLRAALSPDAVDARTAERTVRLGLADAMEAWLLPRLVRALARDAAGIRLVVVPVQFRTVGEALASGRAELAVTVADELPAGITRRTLFVGDFVCVLDPRHARPGRRLTRASYLAHEHVVVSYNQDVRGIVEDLLGEARKVRVSVSSFHAVGRLVEGGPLLATVPRVLALDLVRERRALRIVELPFELPRSPLELLTRASVEDDPSVAYVRELVSRLCAEASERVSRRPARRSGSAAGR